MELHKQITDNLKKTKSVETVLNLYFDGTDFYPNTKSAVNP